MFISTLTALKVNGQYFNTPKWTSRKSCDEFVPGSALTFTAVLPDVTAVDCWLFFHLCFLRTTWEQKGHCWLSFTSIKAKPNLTAEGRYANKKHHLTVPSLCTPGRLQEQRWLHLCRTLVLLAKHHQQPLLVKTFPCCIWGSQSDTWHCGALEIFIFPEWLPKSPICAGPALCIQFSGTKCTDKECVSSWTFHVELFLFPSPFSFLVCFVLFGIFVVVFLLFLPLKRNASEP